MFALTSFVRHPARASQRRALLRVWVVGALLALAALQVLVGSLGLMHRSVHGVAIGSSHLTSAALKAAQPQATQRIGQPLDATHSLLAHLFGGHHGDTDCEWFDRMALGGALLPALPELGTLPPAGQIGWTAHALLLRQSPALFWARGPPLLLS